MRLTCLILESICEPLVDLGYQYTILRDSSAHIWLADTSRTVKTSVALVIGDQIIQLIPTQNYVGITRISGVCQIDQVNLNDPDMTEKILQSLEKWL